MSKLSLAVEKAAKTGVMPTGPADIRDQRWLDEQIIAIDSGFQAVVNIAHNWTDGRNLSRLHPGMAAAEYVTARVGVIGKAVVPVLLTESNWSQRQIASVAGVSPDTVSRTARELSDIGQLERPAETLGADGKLRALPGPRVVEAVVIDDGPAPRDDRWNPGSGLMTSLTPEWYTPRHVIDAVVVALGGSIDLDPCAEAARGVPAGMHITEDMDGLAREWLGTVYMNPPYGRGIGDWTGKLAAEYRAGRVTEAVALLPARTETDWWAALDPEWICFIHGRLAFSDHATAAPFPSAAIYLGPEGERFADAFADLGPTYRRFDR